MTQPLYTVRQLAYVVRDMDAALKYWTEILKVGPFYLLEHCPLEDQVYRGSPGEADVTLALGNSGDLQIELIYQHNDAGSVYKEFLDAGREGVHHFGMMPTDYAATCAQYKDLGHEAAFECTVGGAPLVYFDTVATLGHFTELWERSDSFLEFQRSVREAASTWDGSDPIRNGAL